jgi:hypothetical protein
MAPPASAETMAAPAVTSGPPAGVPPPPAMPTPPAPARAGGDRTAKLAFAVLIGVAVLGVAAFLALRPSGSPKKVATKQVVTIGPKVVDVPGTQAFTDTGIVLKSGDDVAITATGTVFPAVGARSLAASPDGVPNHPEIRPANVVPNVDHSGLIGRVGDVGSLFAVGHNFRFTTTVAGTLFLGINDSGLENNDGAFQATVTVTRH